MTTDDDDGFLIESTFITDILERIEPKMIYLVPTFQNPINIVSVQWNTRSMIGFII